MSTPDLNWQIFNANSLTIENLSYRRNYKDADDEWLQDRIASCAAEVLEKTSRSWDRATEYTVQVEDDQDLSGFDEDDDDEDDDEDDDNIDSCDSA
jgi:hypothetical protein